MILIISILLSLSMENQTKIIYVGDPMCSWCYGVGPELEGLKEHFDGTAEFEMVMGGLRPYNTQTMYELKDFLTEHWDHVNKGSGQVFSFDVLNSKEITYDTEPPSRAVVIVRDLKPEQEFHFFHEIQKSFYQDGKNMHLAESYHSTLEEIGIDTEEFDRLFHSDEMKAKVKLDFQKSRDLGVGSFPTILLSHEGKVTLIANGFSTKKEMVNKINAIIGK